MRHKTSDFYIALGAIKDQAMVAKALRREIEKDIKEAKQCKKKEKHSVEVDTKAIELIKSASDASRSSVKTHFEDIVTQALQFVTQSSDYKFIIEEKNSGNKPGYEFYIQSSVNGTVTKQKPEDANGGGFVDIISVSLKFAYLILFSNPTIKNSTILLDEPGKMISNAMSIKFAEYLKFLAQQYNKQIIMITHNENLINLANEHFTVVKDVNGISNVVNEKDLPLNLLMDLFNGTETEE